MFDGDPTRPLVLADVLWMHEHMTEQARTTREIKAELSDLSTIIHAFPVRRTDGKPDIDGHRTDHESRMMDAAASQKRMDSIKTVIVEKTVSGIYYAVVFLLLMGAKDLILHPTPDPTISKITQAMTK
jgi:hypothetical protein